MDINNIVSEWFYRLPNGYANPPYTEPELDILKEVLVEYNISNWQQIMSFISEDDEQTPEDTAEQLPPKEVETHESNEDFRNLLDSFEQFSDIINRRYIQTGLQVDGLDTLYQKIMALPDTLQDQLRRIIGKRTNRDLFNGTFKMGQYEKILYDLVVETIQIPGISPAVFWFAIVLDGNVKGKSADGTITADVHVDAANVILRNFHNEAVSFGLLDPEIISILTILINLGEVIDGEKIQEFTKSNINSILAKIGDEGNKEELNQFLNMSNVSRLASLKALSTNIKTSLENQNIDELPSKFCALIDAYIAKILATISYWGTIRGDMVYLTEGDTLYPSLNCTKENRLGGGIFNIKDNHLNILGDVINEKLI